MPERGLVISDEYEQHSHFVESPRWNKRLTEPVLTGLLGPKMVESILFGCLQWIIECYQHKKTVETYIDGFRTSDHELVLSCLTNDVEWDIPGMHRAVGKDEFDKEIENEAFVGGPTLTITRMTEENDVVIAEGTVRATKREGGLLNAVFCDAFPMRNGKIKHLISYLMELK